MSRSEADVTRVFVSLATSLANGAEVVELLSELTEGCARLLDVASAGLLLADQHGTLHVLAASSQRARELEVFQVQRAEGPCLDSYRNSELVRVPDLAAAADRWPSFVPHALQAGFASVHALPLRRGELRLGTLGLFGTGVGALDDDDLSLGRALADVAAVALVQDFVLHDSVSINEQLQAALGNRVVLEQAKGVLAQEGDLDMVSAFQALRGYARDHDQRLADVSRAVVGRQLAGRELLDHARSLRA